jgi:hypothetical protein
MGFEAAEVAILQMTARTNSALAVLARGKSKRV